MCVSVCVCVCVCWFSYGEDIPHTLAQLAIKFATVSFTLATGPKIELPFSPTGVSFTTYFWDQH